MPEITRLYNLFKPENYNIEIDFSENYTDFSGVCVITGIAKDNTVKLHASGLTIISVEVNETEASFSQDNSELIVELGKVTSSKVKISIAYSGEITQPMHGIYPCNTAEGKTIIATQFESHHAREAFPCIDEPEAKATFDILIKTVKNIDVIGNMPIKSQQSSADRMVTSFETTPIMSTYLVAFVFGELQKVSAKTVGGTEVSVYSSPNHDIESLVFPLEVAVKTIEFLNDYFGIEYPLPKLDQVALPDFSSGAMENWGLVTYREIALLADPDTISTASKEYIATVIAHELSHQWFGNLVTMRWWDDLWLNESFANLMEYLIVDALYPEWNVMLSFASHDALSAFRRDILPGVQAVATPVNHPDEISTLFDPSIVYAKGSRLLLMAYNLVGDRAFRKGLNNYFKQHAYKNTVGEDLWRALGDASGIDVASIMHAWIVQPGLPYISVSQNGENLHIEQNRLISEETPVEMLWPIPLWPSTQLSTKILEGKSVDVKNAPENVRFNTIGGHYVTNYQNSATKKSIRDLIAKNEIKPDGRLLILHDSLILARCGVTSITQTLNDLTGYQNEDQEAVWSVISLVLSDARMLVEGQEDAEQIFKDFTYNLISKKLQELGWQAKDGESSNDKKLRSILVSLAIYSENQTAIDQALNIYRTTDDIEELPSDIRGALLTCITRHGTPQEYQHLMDIYPITANADIQLDITGGLCATKDEAAIKSLISKLTDQDFVRLQDLDRFLVYLLRSRFSRAQAWNWLVENWDWLTEKFASDMSYDSYPRYAGATFSTNYWLNEYKKQFDPLKDVPALARNIELGVKDIESKIAWRNKDQANLATWLKSQ